MAPRAKASVQIASEPAKAAASIADDTSVLGFIPEDPADTRLSVEGAVCDKQGSLNIVAYTDMMKCWAGEPAPEHHPDPHNPGTREDEEIPKGLRMWDDVRDGSDGKDGAGWIALKTSKHFSKKERWFNIRTCGSWRCAFLLARLQLNIWEQEEVKAMVAHAVKQDQKSDLPATPSPAKRKHPKHASKQIDTPPKRVKVDSSNVQGLLDRVQGKDSTAPATKLTSVLDRIRARMKKDADVASA